MVLLLLRTQVMVSLLKRERVSRNRTRQHVDRWRFVPQVCFTYFPILYTYMHWGKLHVFLLGWGKWKVSVRVKSE